MRETRKLLLFGLSALVVACSTYREQQASVATAITRKDEAIQIARREMARRAITLPPGITMKVEQGTVMVEVGPDIPIYVVSFYASDQRKSRPLYVVSVDRRNGRIESFTDTKTLIPVGQ
jgi:hypothetical protein